MPNIDPTIQTITVFARVPFTDERGSYEVNQQVDLPYNTDADKANVASLVAYGVVAHERKPL